MCKISCVFILLLLYFVSNVGSLFCRHRALYVSCEEQHKRELTGRPCIIAPFELRVGQKVLGVSNIRGKNAISTDRMADGDWASAIAEDEGKLSSQVVYFDHLMTVPSFCVLLEAGVIHLRARKKPQNLDLSHQDIRPLILCCSCKLRETELITG